MGKKKGKKEEKSVVEDEFEFEEPTEIIVQDDEPELKVENTKETVCTIVNLKFYSRNRV